MEHGELAEGGRALLRRRLTRPRLGRPAAALLVGLVLGCAPARAAAPSVPYMGVNTWYGYGAAIDQRSIVELTNAVVDRGLRGAGYRYVWLDAGWWDGARDRQGNISLDPLQ